MSVEISNLLRGKNISFSENENVASRSSFKIGGVVRFAIFPDTKEKLIYTLDMLTENKIRFEVVGNASNILFGFEFYDGALVFTNRISDFCFEGEKLFAECGVPITYLSGQAAGKMLSGLEFAYGIPALVGGAVYMNAGAYGSCVSDLLQSSLAYDTSNKKLVTLDKKEHDFGYRHSIFMTNKNLVCLEAVFLLKSGSGEEIKAKMQENMKSRLEKQPLEYPSGGSYFKRPDGHFAGKLIEDCGLKGMRVGGAEVSVKHAGFIVNRGGASALDVLLLEEKIKERVMSCYGVELEREVQLIK